MERFKQNKTQPMANFMQPSPQRLRHKIPMANPTIKIHHPPKKNPKMHNPTNNYQTLLWRTINILIIVIQSHPLILLVTPYMPNTPRSIQLTTQPRHNFLFVWTWTIIKMGRKGSSPPPRLNACYRSEPLSTKDCKKSQQ